MYGVIDIGSNTIRLKIYKYINQNLQPIIDKKVFAKLASYIINNELSKEGEQVLIDTLKDYKYTLTLLGIERYYIFATASLRNALNGYEVSLRIKDMLGLDIKIISGEEEALYDYLGVKSQAKLNSGILVDIGGGSSEVVVFENNQIITRFSIPIGSLNTYTRYVKKKFPRSKEIKEIKKAVIDNLKKYPLTIPTTNTILGVGGTIRALNKLKQKETITNNQFKYQDLKDWLKEAKKNTSTWENTILDTIPERIYTITTGLVILKTIMKYYQASDVIVSNFGIREGYLLNILKEE